MARINNKKTFKIAELEYEVKCYKKRIDKAIECIDKWRNYDGDYSVEEEELLEILKGSDKECK